MNEILSTYNFTLCCCCTLFELVEGGYFFMPGTYGLRIKYNIT